MITILFYILGIWIFIKIISKIYEKIRIKLSCINFDRENKKEYKHFIKEHKGLQLTCQKCGTQTASFKKWKNDIRENGYSDFIGICSTCDTYTYIDITGKQVWKVMPKNLVNKLTDL